MASYASLPNELVNLIVDLVHEQDRAWAYHGLAHVTGDHQDNAQVCRSPWYRRGIQALARADRCTRALAVPHLYESITAKQTDARYFRLHVLGESLGQHVRRVDCVMDPADHAFSLACALRKLPNLDTIGLGDGVLAKLRQPLQDIKVEDDAVLVEVLRDSLARVTSLEIIDLNGDVLLDALESVGAGTLRKLSIRDVIHASSPGHGLWGVLHGLAALVELHLGHPAPVTDTAMQAGLRLVHLRTLKLAHMGTDEDSLHLAHHTAPSLSTLTIRSPRSKPSIPRLAEEALPSPLLPTLRILAVEQAAKSFLGHHKFRLPALEHLDLSLSGTHKTFPLEPAHLANAPASLQRITLSFTSRTVLAPSDALLRSCAAAGVHLVVHRQPVSVYAFTQRVTPRGAGASAAGPRGAPAPAGAEAPPPTALDETLEWARNRARWLDETGDRQGLQEMVEAAAGLHERRLVDLA